jgi:hypothetical protein
MRSSTPPCPWIDDPQSFTPRSRLIADMVNPPRKPMTVMTKAIPIVCHMPNGVTRQSDVPIRVAERIPPMNPYHVLLGLITGEILWRPRSLPQTYCNTSLSCTITTRKKSRRAFFPA